MGFPGVKITVSDGNLQRYIDSGDVAAMVASEAVLEPSVVYSLDEAKAKLGSEHPILLQMATDYYNEIGGKSKLWLMGAASGKKVVDIAGATDNSGLRYLMAQSGNAITLIGIACTLAVGTELFTDETKAAASGATKSFCEAMAAQNTPVRVLIGAKVGDKSKGAGTFKPRELENPYCGIVVGSTTTTGCGAVGTALGRAVKYDSHEKIGSGRNGSLKAESIYVGGDAILGRSDIEDLHDLGFITFHRRAGSAGYYFGVDWMCTAGDFKYLAHGRVIDKATRLIAASAISYVEDNVPMNSDGTIDEGYLKEMETMMSNAVSKNMTGEISGVSVNIDSSQDIINSSTLAIKFAIQPLGYSTWIECEIGLATTIN